MDAGFAEALGYIGTGIGTVCLYLFGKNEKMQEGITDAILKRMNKTKINKIDLATHKIFGLLEQRQSSLATFIIEDPMKMKFYSTYIDVVFKEISNTSTNIIELEKEKGSLEDKVMKELYALHTNVDIEINKRLHIPLKVNSSFAKWRAMLTNALNESMREIIHDDLMNSNYMLAYRVLDVFVFYVSTLLHTGAVEMARLNGAFKNLTIKDIIKDGEPK